MISYCFFFFQAEDGIRDLTVTGVQTCALPISTAAAIRAVHRRIQRGARRAPRVRLVPPRPFGCAAGSVGEVRRRSEEHTSELQSQSNLVCRLLLEKKKKKQRNGSIHTC